MDAIKAFFLKLMDTPDHTGEFTAEDASNHQIISAFSYLWLLCLVPLFGSKDSKFAKFHASQGLTLAVFETACWIVFTILEKIPVIGWIFGGLRVLFNLATTLISIFGIFTACNGKAKELPLLGGVHLIK